jgi:hypothetical protein
MWQRRSSSSRSHVNRRNERWDENAHFIAHARTDVPRLIAEIRRLQALLDSRQT